LRSFSAGLFDHDPRRSECRHAITYLWGDTGSMCYLYRSIHASCRRSYGPRLLKMAEADKLVDIQCTYYVYLLPTSLTEWTNRKTAAAPRISPATPPHRQTWVLIPMPAFFPRGMHLARSLLQLRRRPLSLRPQHSPFAFRFSAAKKTGWCRINTMTIADNYEHVLDGKYPAKEHARKVARWIVERGGDKKGTIYLEAQKQRFNEAGYET